MARSVNNRRTIDGSFFEAINPSLFQGHLPTTQPPRGPYMRTLMAMHRPKTAPQGAHMGSAAADKEFLAATQEAKAAARPGTALPPVKSGSQTLKGGATGKMNATWLTPLQTVRFVGWGWHPLGGRKAQRCRLRRGVARIGATLSYCPVAISCRGIRRRACALRRW